MLPNISWRYVKEQWQRKVANYKHIFHADNAEGKHDCMGETARTMLYIQSKHTGRTITNRRELKKESKFGCGITLTSRVVGSQDKDYKNKAKKHDAWKRTSIPAKESVRAGEGKKMRFGRPSHVKRKRGWRKGNLVKVLMSCTIQQSHRRER